MDTMETSHFIIFGRIDTERQTVTSTIFILALAWTDLFTCSVIIPLTIAFIATDRDLGNDLLCKLYQFLITFNVPLAAFIMVAIAVDRYFSICHPFLHAVTPRRARVTVFFLCIFAFLLGTITALAYGYGNVAPDPWVTKGSAEAHTSLPWVNVTSLPLLTSVPEVVPSVENVTWRNVGDSVSALYQCYPNGEIVSLTFLLTYQKFYAAFYLLSLLSVLIIYAFIYRSVVKRREWRRRQR